MDLMMNEGRKNLKPVQIQKLDMIPPHGMGH